MWAAISVINKEELRWSHPVAPAQVPKVFSIAAVKREGNPSSTHKPDSTGQGTHSRTLGPL